MTSWAPAGYVLGAGTGKQGWRQDREGALLTGGAAGTWYLWLQWACSSGYLSPVSGDTPCMSPFGWVDSSGGMTILLTSPSALLLVDSVIPQAAVRWTVRPTTRWVWKGRGTAVGVYGMAGRGSCPVFTQPVHPPCPLLLPKLSQTNPPHRDEDLGVAPWTGNSLRVKLLGWMVSLAPCTQLGCSWH